MRNNPHGIGPLDHFSIPCKEPERSQSFYETVFSARVYEDENGPYVFGTAPEDRALERSVHIFMIMDNGQRFELLGHDLGGVAPAGTHHAFKIGPNDLPAVRAHLERCGIPYWGPATHRGTAAVSIYFNDPDGNVLEFCCWGGYPDLASVPLSQHMAKPSLAYVWDAEARVGRPPVSA
jgi:catechol 2,3-dioxygenase-like lactoylglutathione lyase family enzyme